MESWNGVLGIMMHFLFQSFHCPLFATYMIASARTAFLASFAFRLGRRATKWLKSNSHTRTHTPRRPALSPISFICFFLFFSTLSPSQASGAARVPQGVTSGDLHTRVLATDRRFSILSWRGLRRLMLRTRTGRDARLCFRGLPGSGGEKGAACLLSWLSGPKAASKVEHANQTAQHPRAAPAAAVAGGQTDPAPCSKQKVHWIITNISRALSRTSSSRWG